MLFIMNALGSRLSYAVNLVLLSLLLLQISATPTKIRYVPDWFDYKTYLKKNTKEIGNIHAMSLCSKCLKKNPWNQTNCRLEKSCKLFKEINFHLFEIKGAIGDLVDSKVGTREQKLVTMFQVLIARLRSETIIASDDVYCAYDRLYLYFNEFLRNKSEDIGGKMQIMFHQLQQDLHETIQPFLQSYVTKCIREVHKNGQVVATSIRSRKAFTNSLKTQTHSPEFDEIIPFNFDLMKYGDADTTRDVLTTLVIKIEILHRAFAKCILDTNVHSYGTGTASPFLLRDIPRSLLDGTQIMQDALLDANMKLAQQGYQLLKRVLKYYPQQMENFCVWYQGFRNVQVLNRRFDELIQTSVISLKTLACMTHVYTMETDLCLNAHREVPEYLQVYFLKKAGTCTNESTMNAAHEIPKHQEMLHEPLPTGCGFFCLHSRRRDGSSR